MRVRKVRGQPIRAAPPWKVMGATAGVGLVIVGIGVALNSSVVVLVGTLIVAATLFGFAVPGFRDVRERQTVDRESYFGFVANLFRTTPHAPDDPRRRSKADDRCGHEADE
jgi:hypothetical protein